ncbi:LLM class flavin-dependent oxidoreductase [Rhodovarius crocodyli]|uniref:LLM class flavin-dependent oxidoreductase n=1 Tax=Rhodovarius crocodyli TaxID=1979269 RepID=A0A437M3N6_9PROT|nr:LLM class flavin-dependent oxidoreductase [Rhodovarius crocodyli]RVT92084.1 LLM class flavin-dependent oxidoreductase [Rhodovarius crocodyli]
MTPAKRQLHLNLFIQGIGHHEAAWRHPETNPADMMDIGYYQGLAQKAEAAKFDAVFIADALAINANIEFGPFNNFFEPLTLLAAVAAVTTHIGVIGTASTTYGEPYDIARRFASLDRVSRGRAGWNIVTSSNERAAQNFGHDTHLQHSQRYARATEFLEVAMALWDSWEEEALIADRKAGRFVDIGRVHAIDHQGAHFRVRGPLDFPRPPQGYPVLVQAGSSDDGREFAARFAEAIYTAQNTLSDAQAFYTDVKARMAGYGRKPDQLCILPGLAPIIGRTTAEAKERQQELNEYIIPQYGLHMLSRNMNIDLFSYPLDGPLPELPPIEQINGGKSRFQVYVEMARRGNLTIRQLIQQIAFGRGHDTFAGTPTEIADHIEEWFTSGGCDGFNLLAPNLPVDFDRFVEMVLPELRRRGLFRTEYSGSTLRDHFGLPRPANQFSGRG